MKKLGLITLILVLPAAAFAQTTLQPPAAWAKLQEQQKAKMSAILSQMKAGRDKFLSTHPEIKSCLDQMSADAKERMTAWKIEHKV